MRPKPEDPSTFYSVQLLEEKHFEVWNVPGFMPKYENKNGLSWICGALNHLCKTGSIRYKVEDKNETNLH